jgi:hypothetical protein
LVNVVMAAVLVEYGPQLARLLEPSSTAAMAVIGWGVALVSLVAITALGPLQGDNRPKLVSGVRSE